MARGAAAVKAVRIESEWQQEPVPPVQLGEESVVTQNLQLVRFIAARVASSVPVHVDIDDLVQTGTLGLLDAVRRFDSKKGIPFAAYARYRIRGSILDSLRQMDWATRSQRKQRKALNAQPQAEGAPELPKITFFSLGPVASLSSRSDQKDDLPVPEVACEERDHPDRMYERREARELVRMALNALPERYRQVVLMYYRGEESMREIGRSLGVKESRVSQIHKAALGKMKQALAEQAEASLARVSAA